jgi:hypothetical protein
MSSFELHSLWLEKGVDGHYNRACDDGKQDFPFSVDSDPPLPGARRMPGKHQGARTLSFECAI